MKSVNLDNEIKVLEKRIRRKTKQEKKGTNSVYVDVDSAATLILGALIAKGGNANGKCSTKSQEADASEDAENQ